jgi:benzylsuccinate CoA-transferase BbsE subunit
MADFGAEVIKVEPPGGVAERKIGPFYKDIEDPNRSLHFWHYNTSKKGITLDLQQSEGRDLFRRLVAGADVLLETTKPGTLPELGLTYETLSANNAGLVMCSLTDFGQEGPWRDWLATDMLQLAGGGQMAGSGYDVEDDPEQRPIAPGGGNGYHMGCHYAYIGIMSALYYRNMSGQGQYLDISAHEAAALTTEMHVPNWIYAHNVVQRQTGRHAGVRPEPTQPGTPRGTQMPTADGRFVNGGGGVTPQRFPAFLEWMNRHDAAGDLNDEKYKDPSVQQEAAAHIRELVWAFVKKIPADEAFRGAQEAGMPWGIIRAPDDLLDDEHFRERGFFLEVEHQELGETFTYPGAGAVFSASPQRIYRRAPLIGEDNARVYASIGVDAARLAELQAAGVI